MTTVKEIVSAVAHLPLQELARFRAWFEEFDAQAWDKQIEEDAQAGKLDELADQAIKDHQAGPATA